MSYTVSGFSLQDHVLCDAPLVNSPDLGPMDCVVHSWLDGMITPDFAEIVMGCGGSTAWLAIEEQYLGNRDPGAALDAQFHHFLPT